MTAWDADAARWYADNYGEYATNRLAVDALDGVASDATIVDVGCGTGCALRRVAPRVPNGTLIGVDPVPTMVEIAVERAKGIAEERLSFRCGPAEALPVADGTADLVFAFDSFDHWQDHAVGLQEVRRVLRPQGRFIVVKDGGVPDSDTGREAFLQALDGAGFAVLAEQRLAEGDVTCTMWTCGVVT